MPNASLQLSHHKLKLSFPYNHELIERAKSIPGARWEKYKRYWEYPATIYIYQQIKEKFNVELELPKQKQCDLNKHQFKTTPFAHQIEAVKFLLKKFGVRVK